MPKGVSAKGYKMTENRKQILTLLVEEGGALKSAEGRSTSLMQGLLGTDVSMAALNASLKELERIGFIKREVEGRRTYGISITVQGKKVLAAESPESVIDPKPEPTVAATAEIDVTTPGATTPDAITPVATTEDDWEWKDDESDAVASIPDGIDYDILLAVFLKAALRGMEGPSNGEMDYSKQQLEQAKVQIANLEAEVAKFRAEAASAIAERDQLQKNLNLVISRSEKVGANGARGSDPIRKLLKPEERAALDTLMRQIPTRRGE